jgi:hypothetical protein
MVNMALNLYSVLRKDSASSPNATSCGPAMDLFAKFKEVLVDTALTNWEDIIEPIDEQDKTDVCFHAAIQEIYCKYVGAEARDTQLEYFKTLRKPMKSDPLRMHSSRMLTLARYGNRLPGTDPLLTELQVKQFFPAVLAATVCLYRPECGNNTTFGHH